jgi:hypothetical protein
LPTFALPAFNDWRAAYIAQDGNVHITSLDGQSDITGPALALNTTDTTNSTQWAGIGGTFQSVTSLAVSPNGQFLAYINQLSQPSGAGIAPPTGNLELYNLAPGGANASWTFANVPLRVTHIGGWSPDNTRVVVNALDSTGLPGIYIVAPASPQPQLVPTTGANGILSGAHVVGWLDAVHLLVFASSNNIQLPPLPTATSTPTASRFPNVASAAALSEMRPNHRSPKTYGANLAPSVARSALSAGGNGLVATVDVITGTAYAIATIPYPAQVALSPDATQLVAEYYCNQGCTSPALATETVDTATGALHPLPHSDTAIAPAGNFLWQPGAHTFAVTTVQAGQPTVPVQVSLVDAQQDSSHTLRPGAFALAWSPDGQLLALGDTTGLSTGTGATRVWLVSPTAGTNLALPEPVVAFIGFVRTAQPQ